MISRLFISALFPCLWLSQMAAATPHCITGSGIFLAESGLKLKKITIKKRKRIKEADDESATDDSDAESELGKHPIPVYTDYSQLNLGPRRMQKTYRQRIFKAYRPLQDLSEKLKINRYSSFENPTGIAFEPGESITIRMEGKPRTKVQFIVRDFREPARETRFPLNNGINTFTTEHFGHGYVEYRDSDPDTAPPIKMQIKGGYINGVFTHHDDARVWKFMMKHAKSEMFDILGQRTQWVMDTKALREGCPDDGPGFVASFDEQQKLEQQLLGWEWEGIHPGNHIMGRANWNTKTYMHADGLGASFVISCTPGIADYKGTRRSGAWGTSHELGHVNQTRPGMMWTGTCEVTVNLFSALVNYVFNPDECRLEHENCSALEGFWVRGGRFDCYVNSALVNRELWQYHRGPDNGNTPPGKGGGDSFVTLCPMWQMYLYNTVARGNELFYPRIFKNVRDTDERQWTVGQLRMKYLNRCCDSAKLNFSDFFLETGMLAVMNRLVNDYASHWMTITEDMCRDALKHAAQYPKPDSPVIFYINVNNVGIYRDKLSINPSPDFKPTLTEKPARHFVVPADKWENAVAFEVYNKDKLVRICLRGLNQKDNKSTSVFLPDGATKVAAVQWDGMRYIIYNTAGAGIDARPDKCTGPGAYSAPPKKRKKSRK